MFTRHVIADHASPPAPGTMGPSGFQTFTILSVLDAKTGEDLSVVEAVRRGILDESKRNYKDTLTGEIMVLDTAVKRSKYDMLVFGLTTSCKTGRVLTVSGLQPSGKLESNAKNTKIIENLHNVSSIY